MSKKTANLNDGEKIFNEEDYRKLANRLTPRGSLDNTNLIKCA